MEEAEKRRIPKVLSTLSAILKDTHAHMREAQLAMVASSLAYTTILSIIPVLAVSFSIFKAFGGMEKLYQTIEPMVIQNLAEGASEEAMESIRKFIGNIHAGAIGASGLVGLIITCMSMLFSAEKAINRVWRAPMQRTMFQRISSYWLIITLGPLTLAIAIGAATSANLPLNRFLPSGTGIFVITVYIFFLIYKFVPNRKVNWMPALVAGIITSIVWNLARIAYALYNQKVVTYNKIYGSLGAVPILILWIYIIWLIVLTGAALSAALQRRLDPK